MGLETVPADAAGVRREPLGRDGIAAPPVEAPPPLVLSSANAVLTLPASLRASSAVS